MKVEKNKKTLFECIQILIQISQRSLSVTEESFVVNLHEMPKVLKL